MLGADAATEDALAGRTVLYRDRNGWCPYCERVWLALEARARGLRDESSSRPRLRRPLLAPARAVARRRRDGPGRRRRDPAARRGRAPGPRAAFFPVVSASVAVVRDSFERFHGIMPRFTRASALAPFVFITRIQRAGVVEVEELDPSRLEIVPRFKYSVSLEEVDEILGEYEAALSSRGST